jgi:CheY-like chemotaxis protein
MPDFSGASRRATHVLIVDDYPDGAEVWKMLLETSGFSVATAVTGAAALESAADRAPDAVVLDLQLPDVSGLEVARKLRERKARPLRLIALTGKAMTPELEAQLRQVFDAVLIKPCEPKELLERLVGNETFRSVENRGQLRE